MKPTKDLVREVRAALLHGRRRRQIRLLAEILRGVDLRVPGDREKFLDAAFEIVRDDYD